MNKFISLMLFVFFYTAAAYAQTELNKNDVVYNENFDAIGLEQKFLKPDSSRLEPNSYVLHTIRKRTDLAIFFTINANGKTEGKIKVMTGEKLLVNCFVQDGLVERYEKYNGNTGKKIEEIYGRGDTVVSRYFSKNMELRGEYKNYKGKTVYEYNCSYDQETDRLLSCSLRDEQQGLYEEYDHGILKKRSRTKGLGTGIKELTEEFSSPGKLSSKEIEYSNGNVKKILADGSYTFKSLVSGRVLIKEFNKNGKLIRAYNEVYVSAPASN
ncbi:hypothetical protein B0O44_101657 [Pedobacter nutrimenti]|uniref:Antitoxin component YwqK of YwqJK toxin-antitoxin module n=2 Tax=Pedobacter nutrimenti TaxID=1241337 RepID=A0A318UP00_9SPHI|nr:hypothetical protein B0O44_101657 [Pedobacter nutrimenti]